MDVRDDTAAGDGRLDEGVELLVATDGELQVTRRDTLDAQVLGGVASQLEHLRGQGRHGGSAEGRAGALMNGRAAGSIRHVSDSAQAVRGVGPGTARQVRGSAGAGLRGGAHLGSQVLEDGSRVDGGGGADAALVGHALLEVTVDTADGELQAGLGGPRHRLLSLQLSSITLDLRRHDSAKAQAGVCTG